MTSMGDALAFQLLLQLKNLQIDNSIYHTNKIKEALSGERNGLTKSRPIVEKKTYYPHLRHDWGYDLIVVFCSTIHLTLILAINYMGPSCSLAVCMLPKGSTAMQ